MSDYSFAKFSTRDFEHLIQALALKVIGAGVRIYGDGPDGAREVTFEGPMTAYPSAANPWNGYLLLQVKHCQRPTNDSNKDGKWALDELAADLAKFSDSNRNLRRPEYYIFVTSVVLTPVWEKGTHDKAFEMLGSASAKLGLKGFDVWHFDKLCRYLDAYPEIKASYAHLLTTADTIAKLGTMLDELGALPGLVGAARNENRQTSAENVAAHGESHRKLDNLDEKISSLRPRHVDGHAQIEKAVEHFKKRSFDVASYILVDLRQHHWPELSPREKFRVLANLGHIATQKDGDHKKAATLFLQAADVDPGHEQATALQAVAHMTLGDRELAHKLAEQAVVAAPNVPLPYAVRARTLPDNIPFAEIEAGIPKHLRDDAEVAFALTARVMTQAITAGRDPHPDELRIAEHYVRAAFATDPSPFFQANLGMILVESARQRAISRTFDMIVKDTEQLRVGIQMLTAALSGYGKSPDPELHGRIHLALGVAYALLGEGHDRNKHVEAAFGVAPSDPAVILQQSLVLHDRRDPDAAISLLRKNSTDAKPTWARLMLCKMLARRDGPGDRTEAIDLLKSSLPLLADVEMSLRIQTLAALVHLLGRRGDHDQAEAVIQSLSSGIVHPAAIKAIAADALQTALKSNEAIETIAEAADAITDDTDAEIKFYVAAAAQDLGRHDLAFPLLKLLIPNDAVVPETPRLVVAAEALGEDEFTLDFYRKLRANGILEWRFVSHEAQLLFQYNAVDLAVSVLKQFMASRPNDPDAKLARVALSDIGVRTSQSGLVVTDSALLPRVEEVTAFWGERTVRTLRQFDPTQALGYAYRLVRRFFDRPEAHRAMISSMEPSSLGHALLPAHPVVDNDCAVRYRERGKAEDEWWVIETEPDADLGRREIAPAHAIAQAVKGKRPGGGKDSEFYIDRNGIQDRIGEVLEILDKHVYRLRECADHYRMRFPEEPFFVVAVRAIKQDGTFDAEPLLRSIEQQDQAVTAVETEWCVKRVPVATFATLLGRSVVKAVAHLAARRGVRMWCCLGSLDEVNAAVSVVEKAEELVLDPTALSSLFLSGAFKHITAKPVPLIASAGAVGEFRRLHDEESGLPRGHIAIINGRKIWSEPDKDAQRRSAAALAEFLAWIDNNVRVEDGLRLAELPTSARKRMLENIGRASAESLALAQKAGRVLWTDDTCLAIYARAENIILATVWSQVVANHLASRGQAGKGAVDELARWLLASEFFFVRVSADTILRGAVESEWNSAAEPLRVLLRVFGVPETEPEGLYYFAATTIKHVLDNAPDSEKATDLICALLNRLIHHPWGGYITGQLVTNLASAFWPNTGSMIAADLALRRWLNRQRLALAI